MNKNTKFYLPSFQGYGDFVVTLHIFKMFDNKKSNIRILSSNSCKTLSNELKVNNVVDFINIAGPNGYPSFIDIKRQGLILGLKSLFDIRKKLSLLKKNRLIVFHSYQLKEILIGYGQNSIFLKGSHNIYMQYENFFKDYFTINNLSSNRKDPSEKKVTIFPISQNPLKSFSNKLQHILSSQLENLGINYEFIYLHGEEIGRKNVNNVKVINKTFSDLVQVIQNANLIITCDSLPAHLGEYLDKNVFVLSKKENKYWLPPQAYKLSQYLTFDEIYENNTLPNKLNKFIRN